MTSNKKELLQKYEALSAAVKKIVVEWDPIGVLDDEDWPDDEYDSYIPSICSILMNSAEVSTLESKLNAILELNMGMSPQRSRSREFAAKLWSLRDRFSVGPAESRKS
jgi:hypothetical protein